MNADYKFLFKGILFNFIIIVLVFCIGCGTLINFNTFNSRNIKQTGEDVVYLEPMGGMIIDRNIIFTAGPLGLIFILDLPFSFVGDIVTLPYTIAYQNTKNGKSEVKKIFTYQVPYNKNSFEGEIIAIFRIYPRKPDLKKETYSKRTYAKKVILDAAKNIVLEVGERFHMREEETDYQLLMKGERVALLVSLYEPTAIKAKRLVDIVVIDIHPMKKKTSNINDIVAEIDALCYFAFANDEDYYSFFEVPYISSDKSN